MGPWSSAAQPDRRASEASAAQRTARRALALALEGEPVRLGRVLLLTAGVVVAVTVPLLRPDRQGWLVVAAVSAGMSLLVMASLALPWHRLPRSATALFPLAVWTALGTLGLAAGLGAPYAGLFVLCAAYSGLTQPAGTNLALVLPAAVAWTATVADWSSALAIRLLISVAVWVLLSQLLVASTSRQQALSEALRLAAHTDALTGLPNRRDLQAQLATARPDDTVVLCDIDHFKKLNDTLGHPAGDRVLTEFGAVLRACLRAEDSAARYGGEEFALLLRDTTPEQAGAVLVRLRRRWALLQPAVTFSAGVARCGAYGNGPDALQAADQALYAAKAAGRDCDREAAEPPARQSATRLVSGRG